MGPRYFVLDQLPQGHYYLVVVTNLVEQIQNFQIIVPGFKRRSQSTRGFNEAYYLFFISAQS
jgi:hypothetical protein